MPANNYMNSIQPEFSSNCEGETPKWANPEPLYRMNDAIHPVDGLDPWFGVPIFERGEKSIKLRFGAEMARVLRPETMVFLAEMYAQAPIDATLYVRGHHARNNEKFLTGFKKSQRRGGILASDIPHETKKDEIWLLLPPKRYEGEIGTKSKCGAALATVDDFVVYMLAKHFYKRYLGADLDVCVYTSAYPMHTVQVYSSIALISVGVRDTKKARVDARRKFLRYALMGLSEDVLVANYLNTGTLSGTYRFPDPTPLLEAFERLCALRGKPAVNAWVEHNRRHRPDEAATALLMAEGEPEFWC